MKKFLLLTLFLCTFLLISQQAHALTFYTQPADGKDAQIVAGNQGNKNYGSYGNLTTNWGGGAQNFGLIEFDLGALDGATISSATLGLFHITNQAPNSNFGIYRITSAWEENTVTWNSQPTYDNTVSSVLHIADANYTGWREWNVTDYIQGFASSTYNNYGMLLARQDQLAPVLYFASSDHSQGNEPYLSVEYTLSNDDEPDQGGIPTAAVPEPATMILFSTGLIGAFIRKRFA